MNRTWCSLCMNTDVNNIFTIFLLFINMFYKTVSIVHKRMKHLLGFNARLFLLAVNQCDKGSFTWKICHSSFFLLTSNFYGQQIFYRLDRVKPDHIRQITNNNLFHSHFSFKQKKKRCRISKGKMNCKHWSHLRKRLRKVKKNSFESNEARMIYYVHSEASDGNI